MFSFATTARGIVVATAVVLAVPAAASALSITALPPENAAQPARTFSTGSSGWTSRTEHAGVCLPGLTCPQVTNTRIATGGAGDNGGALRTAASSPLAAGADASGIWESPEFTYDGPPADAVGFAMDRKADIATLLQISATASYAVRLVDVADPARSTVLVPAADLDGARDWTRVTAKAPAGAVVPGRRYRIDIASRFQVAAGAVVDASAEYDNVTLVVGKHTPPTFSGPVAAVASGDMATVTGAVNPSGAPTGVVVEYGPTTAYGSKTAAFLVGDGVSAAPFTIKLTALKRGAAYHYRVVAVSTDGMATTQDGSFSVVTGPASANTTGMAVPMLKPPVARLSARGVAAGVVRRNGQLYLRLRCPASARTACRIAATATAQVAGRTVRAGTATVPSLRPGASKLVALRVAKAARSALARARSLRVRVTVADGGGRTASATRSLRVAG